MLVFTCFQTAKFMPKPQDLDALLSSCESTADAVSVTHLPSQRQLSPTDSALLFLEAVKGFLREPKVSTLGACEVR